MGDLPILGALFRVRSVPAQRDGAGDRRDAFRCPPGSDPTALRLPRTAGRQPPSDLERILLFRQSARSPTDRDGRSVRIEPHSRRSGVRRAMTHGDGFVLPSAACSGRCCFWRAALSPILMSGKGCGPRAGRRQRRQSARDGRLAVRPGDEAFKVPAVMVSRRRPPLIGAEGQAAASCRTAPCQEWYRSQRRITGGQSCHLTSTRRVPQDQAPARPDRKDIVAFVTDARNREHSA